MDLEDVILSLKVRQRQIPYITYMWNVKTNKQMNKHNKTETVIDTENKLVVATGEGSGGMGEIGERN